MLFKNGQLSLLKPRSSSSSTSLLFLLLVLFLPRQIPILQASRSKLQTFFQQMNERTLVPIFIFWVLLTFITPTLILLSENSKADFNLNGNKTEGLKARRMMGYPDNHAMITSPTMTMVEAEEPVPVPAPPPGPPLSTPSLGTGIATLTSPYQNHTLRSNSTDDGMHKPN